MGVDDLDHAMYVYGNWFYKRRTMFVYLRVDVFSPKNTVQSIMRSKEMWERMSRFIGEVMSAKEAEERWIDGVIRELR